MPSTMPTCMPEIASRCASPAARKSSDTLVGTPERSPNSIAAPSDAAGSGICAASDAASRRRSSCADAASPPAPGATSAKAAGLITAWTPRAARCSG